MTDYVALANELNTDLLGRGYSGMSDAEATADINTEYRDVNYPIFLDLLNLTIRENGQWTPFREKAEMKTQPNVYDNQSMREFMDLFGTLTGDSITGRSQYDMQSPYMVGLLDDMVLEGSMSQPIANAIQVIGVETVSRAVELILGRVKTGDVEFARTL